MTAMLRTRSIWLTQAIWIISFREKMDMENRPTNSPKVIFLFKATITRNRSKVLEKPSGVTHDYNPNTHEAEAEGS